MSNGYGIDIYGEEFYGYSQPLDYSVAPFSASQTGYGEIGLYWSSPNITTWKYLHLVRSTYGYATDPADGVLLAEFVPGTIQRSYDDAGLDLGVIYYYTMFISIEAPTWSSATTYLANQTVLLNGQYWLSLQNGNTNHTPSVGSTWWVNTQYIPAWYPAGFAATLSIANQGYGSLLYERTPQPYKISTSDTFTNAAVDNAALEHYLNVFGFGLDLEKAAYDSYLLLNDADSVSATSLDILGQELGIETDYLSTPQQRRQRIKNASVNYRLKGQPQSIHNLIAELAGWDSSISYTDNLMLSGDQSAFVHPSYNVWNANTTYFVNNMVQYNGYNYKNLVQSVGTAQAPTGAATSNTWWQVQQQTLDSNNLLLNPSTAGYSTWGLNLLGATGGFQGILTGLPHPTDTTINNWNALEFNQTNNFLTGGQVEITSTSKLSTPNYSNSVNYSIGANVLYTDGRYYTALIPNGPAAVKGVVAPGSNNLVWKPFYYLTTDRPNHVAAGIPIPQTAFWDTVTSYHVGDIIQYQGITYRAANPNKNSAPTGYYYSNLNWTFLEPSEFAFTVSAYFGSLGAVNGYQGSINMLFYDINGTLIANTSPVDPTVTSAGFINRFVYDHTDLQGVAEPGMINNNIAGWTAVPTTANLWRSSYGMAYVDPTLAGTTLYTYIHVNGSGISGTYGLTFVTDYVDTTHKAHGILFGWQNSSNFFYATRKTLYKVTAGVESVLATWTRLQDGDRMFIDTTDGVHTVVYKYARDGAGTLVQLASVANVPGVGAADTGIIHKYSASGAV